MQYNNFSQHNGAKQTFSPRTAVPVVGDAPKKEPDMPQIETHISIVQAKKDGRLWIKHQTTITDWKPLSYYEKMVDSQAQRTAQQVTGNRR